MDRSSMVINLKPDWPGDCRILKDLLNNILTEGLQGKIDLKVIQLVIG